MMRQLFARRFQCLQVMLLTLGMASTALAQSLTLTAPPNAINAPGVAAGSDVIFTVSSVSAGAPVIISKPADVAYRANSTSPGWTCTGSSILNCTGSGSSFSFSLIMPPEAPLNPISAPSADRRIFAGQGTVSSFKDVKYTVISDIVIQPPSVAALALGATAQLNFNVVNGGPAAPYNWFYQTRVLFTLPNDLVYAGSSTAPWSCSSAGVNVTCLLDEASTLSPVSRPIPLSVRRNSMPSGQSQISYSVTTLNNDPNPSNNQGSVLIPFAAPATVDLRFVGTNPGTQNSGAAFTTLFTLDALQGASATNVDVRFSQPSTATQQIQSISASSTQFICSVDAGGLRGNCFASSFSSPGGANGTLAPVQFTVSGIAPTVATSQSNSITLRGVVSSATSDTNPGNNSDEVVISVVGPTPVTTVLQINKTASSSLVSAGQEYSYSVTATNTGSVAASGVILEDQLVSSLTFIAIEQASAGLNCNQSSGLVRCTQTQLNQGAQASVTIRVRAPTTLGTIPNTAVVASSNSGANQSASASVQVVAGVDLVLDKSDSADPVNVGAEFEYSLSVRNLGTSVARSITLRDDLPSSTSFISASGGGFSCSGGQNLACTLDSLAAGSSATVQVRVRALQAGQAFNSASVATPDSEVSLANNSDSETTTFSAVSVATDLVLTAPSTQSAAVGNDTSVVYTIRNAGPANSSCGTLNLTLSGGIAPAFTLKSVSGLGANCSVSGSTATCALPNIIALAQTQISATLSAIGAASATLSATLNCATDSNLANNSATTTLTGTMSLGADVKLTVRDDDPVVLASEYNYGVTVDNFGPDEARGVSVKFTLPDGTDFVSFSGVNFSCLAQGQIVTCPYSTNLSALATQRTARLTVRVRARAEVGQVTALIELSTTSRDPNLADNTVQETTLINAKDAEQLANVFLPQLDDQFAIDAAPVVADICAKPVPELVAQCEAIIDAALDRDIGALRSGLRAIFPEEVLSERLALIQQSQIQFTNVDSRLNELQRGGRSGLSLSGLNLAFGKTIIPLGLLQPLLDDDEAEVGGSGDLISPWGFFVNGTYSRGDQKLDRKLRTVSSDFNSIGLTAGVDYRLSVRTVFGAALGYSKFDTDLSDDGRTTSKALTLTGYGSHYFNDNLYSDARVTVGNASFDSLRRIRFSYQNFSIDKTALGSNDARQYALAFGLGYNLQKGAWSITPNANIRYFRSNIDGYTETGAGANNVIFDDQQISSLQYNLGVQVSRPISLSHGVLAPQFDISFGHETKDANFALNARLVNATATQLFLVRAQEPDKSFGNIGLGFVYVTSNGRQGYLTYRKLFANDSLQRASINLGARFDF